MSPSRRDFLQSTAAVVPWVSGGSLAALASTARDAGHVWKRPTPQTFRVVENQYVTMKDGARIGVRIWLPDGIAHARVPVVLNYIPYRKCDLTRSRDDPRGESLARNGVAYARADIRGSGASDGVLTDEYLQSEQDDALEIIAWLARQSWSNGAVGMTGISWGGFSALQAAALAPPALKAIMPMCFSDSRYTDDAHYFGGALALSNFQWGVLLKNFMAMPPDPKVYGPRWRKEWMRRLEATPAILAKWTSHQRFDQYWRHGSVKFNYEGVKCPVYCVGGWVDMYNNAIPRILTHLKVPRKALIGPWTHTEPSTAHPYPALDWEYEEVRWWKHWLAGEGTGIMDEPMFRAYMPYRTTREVWPAETPGRWIAEDVWPSPRVRTQELFLQDGHLTPERGVQETLRYRADKIVGLKRMELLPFDMARDLPGDQSSDDDNSLVFDTQILAEDIEILGSPILRIRVAADVPVAKLAARLTEVTPDGASWEVTHGLLNVTHRTGHETPTPLTPGEAHTVEIPLNVIAHRFKAGNRIRLALSESLWPLVWPSPAIATLTIATGGDSRLLLPVRPMESNPASFPIPVMHAPSSKTTGVIGFAGPSVQVTGPDQHGRIVIEKQWSDVPVTVMATGTVFSAGWRTLRLEIDAHDPNSCVWSGDAVGRFERADWGKFLIHSRFKVTSTSTFYQVMEAVNVTEGTTPVFERRADHRIPREFT